MFGDLIRSKAKDLAKENKPDFKEKVKDKFDSITQKTKEEAEELYEKGRDMAHDIQTKVAEYPDTLSKAVKKKPLSSLLIAGGVGIILTLLFKKK